MHPEDDVKPENMVAAYQEMAEQGDAVAQYKLGCCYYHGDGVGCDYQEAVKWFRKAAEQGNAAAQNSLGDCYRFGRGVEKDYAEAMKWYRKAAEQGYVPAQINLGQIRKDEMRRYEKELLLSRQCRCEEEERLRRERCINKEWLRRKRCEEEDRIVQPLFHLEKEWVGMSRIYSASINCLAMRMGTVKNFVMPLLSACFNWCALFPMRKHGIKHDVIASTFSPSQVRKNSNLLVSVFLHTRAEAEDIKRLAREIYKDAERRSYKPLACKLKEGDRVDVSLNIYGGNKLLLSQAKSIIWQGVHDSCTFRYFITEDFPMDEICCEVNLSLNNVPIGEMLFNVKIGEVEDNTPAEFGSREYNKIFISYSHDDVAKVKYIANAYRLEGKEYFFDRHYLKSGDVYPEEIKNFINTSDLFILCWSANASKSEYVRKELSQALNLAYPKIQPREKARLTIRPISIDPRADPPDEMKDIYNFEEF